MRLGVSMTRMTMTLTSYHRVTSAATLTSNTAITWPARPMTTLPRAGEHGTHLWPIAGIPRRRHGHGHRHGLPRRLPREDRREDVGVSDDFPVQLPTRLVGRRSAAVYVLCCSFVLHESDTRIARVGQVGDDPRSVADYIAHNRQNVVIWSFTTDPVAFRLPFRSCTFFTNLEVQERYLPIIRGAWTAFPCVQCHFNHCHHRQHTVFMTLNIAFV